MGITAAGSSVGGVVFPIMLQHLEDKFGFQWAVRIVAFVNLGSLTIAVFTMRARIHTKETVTLWSQLVDLHGFCDIRYILVAVSSFLCVATVRGISAAADTDAQVLFRATLAVFLHRRIRQPPGGVFPHHTLPTPNHQWLCDSGTYYSRNFGRPFRSVRVDSPIILLGQQLITL